jgi:hypothetical protein
MSNSFRALLAFALDVHNRELQRAGGVDGGIWSSDALSWREDFAPREGELNDLFAAALNQAGRTGFPLSEVERRLRNLQKHIRAIMLWPRDAPRLSEEQQRERKAAGSWTDGPVSAYLHEHASLMMKAWQTVESLALRVDRIPDALPRDVTAHADYSSRAPGPPPHVRFSPPRSAAPVYQDMRVLAFMVYWELQLQTGAGRDGQPEHYQLPEQGETANDRAALKLLRACCSGYFEAEKTVLAFLNLDPDFQKPILRSMLAILAGARKAAASSVLFDGEDIPTADPPAETGAPGGAGHRPEPEPSPNTGEATAAPESVSRERPDKPSMTWQEAAERLKRLRAQGEPWTSYRKLAEQLACSPSVVYKAIQQTSELHSWAKRLTAAAPTAQSINDAVTDSKAQHREPNPEDDAAIREYIESADPETKAWFLALSLEEQLDFLDDPDKHRKILGRRP